MVLADNSDEDEQGPDDEDLDFISNDMADGVEESIIVDEAIVDDDSNEIIENVALPAPKKRWSARMSCSHLTSISSMPILTS